MSQWDELWGVGWILAQVAGELVGGEGQPWERTIAQLSLQKPEVENLCDVTLLSTGPQSHPGTHPHSATASAIQIPSS